MKRPEYYTRSGRGKRPKFAAYDLETEGLGGKVLAASYMMEGENEASYIAGGSELSILQRLFDVMCEHNDFTWFAHNAQYEFRYFIDYLTDNRDHVHFFLRTDSDVFMIIIDLPDYGERCQLRLRDSYAIWDLKLSQVTATFCPDLPKLDLDFEGGVIFDPDNPEHVAYSKRDSHALLLSLIRFNDILYETFDCNMALTRSGTALAAWQRTLSSSDKYRNYKEDEDFIRSAYYGGLVFLTSTRTHEGAKTYDRNSSYPTEMLNRDLPYGKSVRTKLFSTKYLGIYDVTVRAPDNLIVPILPKRDKKGIVWPRGVFRTVITSEELNFAVANGYGLLKIHDGRIWQTTCTPFVEFVTKCMEIRLNNPSGSTLDWTAKYMQNGLYGKFGAKRKRRKIYATLTDDEMDGASFWGDFFIKDEVAEDMQCLPQWSVFITAYARISLLRVVYGIRPDNVLYGDTDSITVKSGVTLGVGKAYGQWKLEKEWRQFRAHGPKVYAGTLENGKLLGAAKGIPKRRWEPDRIFEAILNADTDRVVRYQTLERFVISLKSRYIGQRDAHRAISSIGNSRTWREEAGGEVRPRYWHEIEALHGTPRIDQGAVAKTGDLWQRDRVA